MNQSIQTFSLGIFCRLYTILYNNYTTDYSITDFKKNWQGKRGNSRSCYHLLPTSLLKASTKHKYSETLGFAQLDQKPGNVERVNVTAMRFTFESETNTVELFFEFDVAKIARVHRIEH